MDTRFSEPHSEPRWWWGGDYTPTCFACKHFRGASKGKIICVAFPEGIPPALFEKGVVHNTPYLGDNGIQFEKYEED